MSDPKKPKTLLEAYQGKPRMSYVWWVLFDRYRQCQAFRCLPRAGALLDQDPLEMRMLYEIHTLIEANENRSRVGMAKSMGPLGALLSLTVLGNRR